MSSPVSTLCLSCQVIKSQKPLSSSMKTDTKWGPQMVSHSGTCVWVRADSFTFQMFIKTLLLSTCTAVCLGGRHSSDQVLGLDEEAFHHLMPDEISLGKPGPGPVKPPAGPPFTPTLAPQPSA